MVDITAGAQVSAQETIGSAWERLGPPIPWDEALAWPPDVFAFTDLLLSRTEAYRFVSSPPRGAMWPPHEGWSGSVRIEAKGWSEATSQEAPPRLGVVLDRWETLGKARELPLEVLARGEPWNVCEAIITLHALADEASSPLSALGSDQGSAFAERAWATLESEGSLSRFPPSQVRVLPKTHVPGVGITVRSLSRYLSAHTSPVEVRWRRDLFRALTPGAAERTFNILLLPWPLTVGESDFRPIAGLNETSTDGIGFFEFDPQIPLDLGYVRSALEAARSEGGAGAVILPESSVAEREIPLLERTVRDFEVFALVAGIRGETDPDTGFRRNYAHIGIRTGEGWNRFEQDKHHRWLLDARQIGAYRLERSLDPARKWWEAIAVPSRSVEIFDFGGGASTAAVICEDLAREDEAADVIRRIGPTTVFALLLDGPQLPSRWPSRYASVLADDPGSTVITMTSLGMALRSVPHGTAPSRSVALWKDAERGLREIELAPGADAALVIASETWESAWTADGRRHEHGTPRLVLEDVHQLRTTAERLSIGR